MDEIKKLMEKDPEYIKAIKNIDKDLNSDKYTITKKEAIDNRIDSINNASMTKIVEKVIINYENVIEQQDNIIDQQQQTIETYAKNNEILTKTIKNNDIPLPKLELNTVHNPMSSSDTDKINKGMNRILGFFDPKPGDKFSITSTNGVSKTYRIKN